MWEAPPEACLTKLPSHTESQAFFLALGEEISFPHICVSENFVSSSFRCEKRWEVAERILSIRPSGARGWRCGWCAGSGTSHIVNYSNDLARHKLSLPPRL